MGSVGYLGNYHRFPPSAAEGQRGSGGARPHDLTRTLEDYQRYADVSDRFWAKVERRGNRECWPWLAGKRSGKGYGTFKFESFKTVAASRMAYALWWRQDPGPLVVMHTCDNPACCNPAHLVLGTVADNSADMVAKGRWRGRDSSGTKNPMARLTEDDVREIKRRIAAGHKNTHIGADYGVTHSLISAIRRGLIWKDVA